MEPGRGPVPAGGAERGLTGPSPATRSGWCAGTQLQSDTAWVVGGIRTLADASDPEDLKAVTALQSPARDPGTLIIPGCCNRVWRLARET